MKNYHYKYLFGPVPSRRLGISLGIDLIPHKTCSLDCIYCECGPTTHLTVKRKRYVPTKKIIHELIHFLSDDPKLDYITFSGSGEPTLHSGIKEISNFLKINFPKYKVALLTNGTLFYQPGIREDVKKLDLILPSLDSATDHIFHKINRPDRNLKIKKIIEGLVELRSTFSGEMRLEIFIVPGINDDEVEIFKIREAIQHINPDKVQLNTLDRPGTKHWIRPASYEELEKIAHQLNHHVEIIKTFRKRDKISSYNHDIEHAIKQTIKRRPCTLEDLSSMLDLHTNEINKYLDSLLSGNRIKSVAMGRGLFYSLKGEKQ
jgi:wyosine [tRNA(Phe)-imidazoG37] synthetase (radical SAM superfamily)